MLAPLCRRTIDDDGADDFEEPFGCRERKRVEERQVIPRAEIETAGQIAFSVVPGPVLGLAGVSEDGFQILLDALGELDTTDCRRRLVFA